MKITFLFLIVFSSVLFLLLLGTASAALINEIRQPDNNTGKDGYLQAGLPNQNFGASNSLDIKPSNDRNTLFEFNLSSIPAQATIIAAELELYVLSLGIGPNPLVYIHRLTRSWTEGTGNGTVTNNGATWNTYNGTANWDTNGGDYDLTIWNSSTIIKPVVNVWYSWKITDLVKSWVNGTHPNYGLLIRTNTTNSGISSFASSDYSDIQLRPKLTINYTLPLTFTFVNPTPNSGSTILTNSAVINISLTNGNATQAQLEWNGVNYSMAAGSAAPSTMWSLNKTSLANVIYTYKVYALDSGTGVFDVSETRTVTVNACTENWVASYGDCLTDDTKLKYYNDTNYCSTYDNLPIDNGTYAACDYCPYNIVSTSWSSWQNQTSCLANDTFKQNQSLTEYDANAKSCYAITNLASDLWNNGINNTYWNYQSIACDYCIPSLTNTSWSSWENSTSCLANDTYQQKKELTQYDNNFCGEISNQTFFDYQQLACDYIISTEFGGTDLSAVDLSGIPNLVLTTNYGRINFSETISISRSLDLDSYVDISHNLISINTINLPELNKSAVLTLYNLTFTNPTILKDGLPCEASICTKISYETGSAGSNLTFNVSGFSNYSAAEGMYCGDSSCNNGESCSSCPTDCGSCSDGNSGGSSGRGSSRTSSSLTKEVVPKEAASITSPTQQADIPQPYSPQPSSLETSEAGKETENAEQAGPEEPTTNEKNWAEMMFDSPELELETNGEQEFTIFQLPGNIKASLLTGAAIETVGRITEEVKKNMNDIIVFLLVLFGAASVTYLTLNRIDSKSCRKAKTSCRKNKQKNNCSKKSRRNR